MSQLVANTDHAHPCGDSSTDEYYDKTKRAAYTEAENILEAARKLLIQSGEERKEEEKKN